MKFYSIILHNGRVYHSKHHETFNDALNEIIPLYNLLMKTDILKDPIQFENLVEDWYLYEEVDQDNIFMFEIFNEEQSF